MPIWSEILAELASTQEQGNPPDFAGREDCREPYWPRIRETARCSIYAGRSIGYGPFGLRYCRSASECRLAAAGSLRKNIRSPMEQAAK